MTIRIIALTLAFIPALSLAMQAGEPVSIESLLTEMIDRESIARFPEPEFRLKQESSYNRASKTPDEPKGWFRNRSESVQGLVPQCCRRRNDVLPLHFSPEEKCSTFSAPFISKGPERHSIPWFATCLAQVWTLSRASCGDLIVSSSAKFCE